LLFLISEALFKHTGFEELRPGDTQDRRARSGVVATDPGRQRRYTEIRGLQRVKSSE